MRHVKPCEREGGLCRHLRAACLGAGEVLDGPRLSCLRQQMTGQQHEVQVLRSARITVDTAK